MGAVGLLPEIVSHRANIQIRVVRAPLILVIAATSVSTPAANGCLRFKHAHLDHCGRVPLLRRRCFEGDIIATGPAQKLARLALLDPAHTQEADHRNRLRHRRPKGGRVPGPLYGHPRRQQRLRLLRPPGGLWEGDRGRARHSRDRPHDRRLFRPCHQQELLASQKDVRPADTYLADGDERAMKAFAGAMGKTRLHMPRKHWRFTF